MNKKEEVPFDMVQRFRDICEMENITPYKVWKQTDIPQSTFYSFMKEGNKEISLLNLAKICKALQITFAAFFYDKEDWRDRIREDQGLYLLMTLRAMNEEELENAKKQAIQEFGEDSELAKKICAMKPFKGEDPLRKYFQLVL